MNKNTKIQISVIIVVLAIVGFSFYLPNQISESDPVAQIEDNSTIEETQSEVPLYKPVIDYETAVISAVESANPSVVSVIVTKNIPTIEKCEEDPVLSPEDLLRGRLEIEVPCETEVEPQEVGGGSGFIVSTDGLIITNKHVVSDEEASYSVITNDGNRYETEVLDRDPVQDIAILKIDASNLDLNPVSLGDSDTIKLGQTAIAIGNALGELKNTVSVGVISGLSRNITAAGSTVIENIRGVIQTDAAINRGNSGGPLLNLKGEVVGVNTAVATEAQNIGFAIPINHVKRALQSVQETGSIQTPFLGVRYIDITRELAEERDFTVKRGALVEGFGGEPAVFPGSPADMIGILEGDIIREVNGEQINQNQSLVDLIVRHEIGEEVSLKILRDGKEITLNATLVERPDL